MHTRSIPMLALCTALLALSLSATAHADTPSQATNKAVVREFEEEFKNKANHAIVDEVMAPTFQARGFGPPRSILELPGDEAAAILDITPDITPAAYRKRLSRAREDMEAFLGGRCGLGNPGAACRCHKLLPAATAAGLVDPKRLTPAALPVSRADRLPLDIERARTAAEVFRSLPTHASLDDFGPQLRDILDGDPN